MSFIADMFANVPKEEANKIVDKYVANNQGACAARVYHQKGGVTNLFFQIKSCQIDKSLTSLGGSFSMTLVGDRNWDEIILPDDYIRVFMGDLSASVKPNQETSVYNFASNDLGVGRQLKKNFLGDREVLLGETYQKSGNILVYERALIKVDRCERTESGSGRNSANVSNFIVVGRLFGSILEDIKLFYSEYLPGLNAINVFWKSGATTYGTPTDFVKNLLIVGLTSVPMPQWILPIDLINDMATRESLAGNKEIMNDALKGLQQVLNAQATSLSTSSFEGYKELAKQSLEFINNPDRSPFNIISIKGLKQCFGNAVNTAYQSNNQNADMSSLIQSMCNQAFCEFWFDMCPDGDPDGGDVSEKKPIPTFVLRHRPYDITQTMVNNQSLSLERGECDEFFPRQEFGGAEKSVEDLMSQAIHVYGPMDGKDESSPMVLPDGYKVGRSGDQRFNMFFCFGSWSNGQATPSTRIEMASKDLVKISQKSILYHGFRPLELSTAYAEPSKEKGQEVYYDNLKKFSHTLANWYSLNHYFLNGTIATKFIPSARLGIPLVYWATRKKQYANRDGAKFDSRKEVFYVQGLSESFNVGSGLSMNFIVTRGLRYKVEKTTVDQVATIKDKIFDKVRNFKV